MGALGIGDLKFSLYLKRTFWDRLNYPVIRRCGIVWTNFQQILMFFDNFLYFCTPMIIKRFPLTIIKNTKNIKKKKSPIAITWEEKNSSANNVHLIAIKLKNNYEAFKYLIRSNSLIQIVFRFEYVTNS
jgi:hypothetical protein